MLDDVQAEFRLEVLAALQADELEALWNAVEKLEGYSVLKADVLQFKGKKMPAMVL
jgi:hypothetical protein